LILMRSPLQRWRYRPEHLARRDLIGVRLAAALTAVGLLTFAWASNSFGLLDAGVGGPQVASASGAVSPDGRSLSIGAVFRSRTSASAVAEVLASVGPAGAAKPWDQRRLETPAAQVTLAAGLSQSHTWQIPLSLPPGRYDAWVWLRVPSLGSWIGVSQRRADTVPFVIGNESPILRNVAPGPISLGAATASVARADPGVVNVSTEIVNRSPAPVAVAIRWGLQGLDDSATQGLWANEPFVIAGGVRWLTAPPGATAVQVRGRALVSAGSYRVRVQLIGAARPTDVADAAAPSQLPASSLDDVLISKPVALTSTPVVEVLRTGPPAGPLAVTALRPPSQLVSGQLAQVTFTVTNLGDQEVRGTAFVLLAPLGDRTPWTDALVSSTPTQVDVPGAASQQVTATFRIKTPEGVYGLSAWIHGTGPYSAIHVDGAFAMGATSIVVPAPAPTPTKPNGGAGTPVASVRPT
jgi:hypothetical protein